MWSKIPEKVETITREFEASLQNAASPFYHRGRITDPRRYFSDTTSIALSFGVGYAAGLTVNAGLKKVGYNTVFSFLLAAGWAGFITYGVINPIARRAENVVFSTAQFARRALAARLG